MATNHPNPFNAVTVITYDLPEDDQVSLDIFNLQGRKIATLVDRRQSAGRHSIVSDGSSSASGIYFYQLQAGDYIATNKMIKLH